MGKVEDANTVGCLPSQRQTLSIITLKIRPGDVQSHIYFEVFDFEFV
jgi:hypothetical protein